MATRVIRPVTVNKKAEGDDNDDVHENSVPATANNNIHSDEKSSQERDKDKGLLAEPSAEKSPEKSLEEKQEENILK